MTVPPMRVEAQFNLTVGRYLLNLEWDRRNPVGFIFDPFLGPHHRAVRIGLLKGSLRFQQTLDFSPTLPHL